MIQSVTRFVILCRHLFCYKDKIIPTVTSLSMFVICVCLLFFFVLLQFYVLYTDEI